MSDKYERQQRLEAGRERRRQLRREAAVTQMTEAQEMAAFVTARLDEWEAAAKAATPGPWVVGKLADETGEHYGSHIAAMGAEKRMLLDMNAGYFPSKHVQTAEHIALHEPMATLLLVVSLRAILAEHQPDHITDAWVVCHRCVDWSAGSWHGDEAGDEWPEDEQHRMAWPCPTARKAAAIWSTHPDYREDWKP